jgi:beta-lactamase superfamily II metal-dependent hydrolase
MKNAKVIIAVAVMVILVAAGAFFGDVKYQQSKSPRFGNFQGARSGQQAQGNQGVRPVNGEIINQDETSITVKLQDGSSKIVLVGDSTTINKSADGSKSDLQVGERVAVFGTQNSDGSVTAQNIQLNPQFRGMPSSSPQ